MERNLERLRELKSSQENIRRALEPLQNRFPDEVGLIWFMKMVARDCEHRIEVTKEALDE